MGKQLSILFAGAECAPFAKVGGLGDVLGSLPQALARQGLKISVIIPKYGSIPRLRYGMKKRASFSFEHAGRHESVAIFETKLPGNPVTYYFLGHRYFAGQDIYGIPKPGAKKKTRLTEVERFALFSHAVVEAVRHTDISPDIIHCHDWHTALIPGFIDELSVLRGYAQTPTVLTIHNLGNQGRIARSHVKKFGKRPDATPALLEDYYDLDGRKLNCLKLGILSADRITTVSPTYAEEILTGEYGAGLESFLKRRSRHLTGIINGIDTALFNPATDTLIDRRFSVLSVRAGKQANKASLQGSLRLPQSNVPLIGLVSRFVHQKGFDIVVKALPALLKKHPFQVVVLGTGDARTETALKRLQKKFRKNIAVRIGFDLRLAQMIYAGSDMFLMPSRFEPCGLGQLMAMRYGSVPIVRATGGLADTVKDRKTGFVFQQATPSALSGAVEKALTLYADKKYWYTMVKAGMHQDFSWKSSAVSYQKLYEQLV